ncbi:MAG: RNA polymerase sigma factor [Cryobacterium sp.]|nr:RNA polymerase sigma factor [Cryobacterium sp.]
MTRSSLEPVLSEAAPALLGYFVRRVAVAEDAADLVNETMIAAWRSEKSAPGDPHAARLWLFGVARNILLHHDRSQRRRDALVRRLALAITEAKVSDHDTALDVRDAVAALPDDLGELIRLVHWDGFSLNDAAEHLNIPASTIRGRHARAKQLLRERLQPVEALAPGIRLPEAR